MSSSSTPSTLSDREEASLGAQITALFIESLTCKEEIERYIFRCEVCLSGRKKALYEGTFTPDVVRDMYKKELGDYFSRLFKNMGKLDLKTKELCDAERKRNPSGSILLLN